MPSIINASTSSGIVQTADTSGVLELQSNGTTELTVASTGVTIADNLLFNSGYGSSAVAYGCRAWVNFNGTSTVAIRASGNVSSITDNGTGDYTVNFTTAMPDANYAVTASAKYNSSTNYHTVTLGDISGGSNPTTTTCRLMSMANTTNQDCDYVTAAFFR